MYYKRFYNPIEYKVQLPFVPFYQSQSALEGSLNQLSREKMDIKSKNYHEKEEKKKKVFLAIYNFFECFSKRNAFK